MSDRPYPVPVPHRHRLLSGRDYLVVALVGLGIAAVSASYFMLNTPPPSGRWPAFWAFDPRTSALVQRETQAFVLKSWLDMHVPYVPAMAVPYLSFLVIVPVAIPLVLVRLRQMPAFVSYGVALVSSQLALDLAYVLFQSTVLREPERRSVFDPLVNLVRSSDQPFNGFPSGHAAWTTIALIALWRSRRSLPRTAAVLIPWLALIYPATVMLRQHYLIDVYSGVFVGFSCYWACVFMVERPALTPRVSTQT